MHLLHQDLTSLILKTFYEVYNELGFGFLDVEELGRRIVETYKEKYSV